MLVAIIIRQVLEDSILGMGTIKNSWMQICNPENKNHEEEVKLDVQFIDNWSIWMDIYLLFRTVGVVFDRKGAK